MCVILFNGKVCYRQCVGWALRLMEVVFQFQEENQIILYKISLIIVMMFYGSDWLVPFSLR